MTFPTIDETHDPALDSWVVGANGHSQFPVQNLPYGLFTHRGGRRRLGVAIGDHILDLAALEQHLPVGRDALGGDSVVHLLSQPAPDRVELRKALSRLLCDAGFRESVEPHLIPAGECQMHLPMAIGDYTDFYVGIHHATNIGKLFRPDNPLLPNYKYVPIGYHGRASSIRPSGVPVRRPRGQRKAADAAAPTFGPSARLDYELELGVWIGKGNALGDAVSIGDAADHIAGFCLLNDWSARDLQAWEYVPLGPFLAKNFHSTISAWVVTAEAMAPFRMAQPPRPTGDPRPLDYLWDEQDQAQGALSIQLEAFVSSARMRSAGMQPHRLSRGDASAMYWTAQQIVTHHASNGCNLMPGDLLGTGTLSGPTPDSFGSLMELSQGGKQAVILPTGEERRFIEDGDEILMRATAVADGRISIGFGECRAIVEPAA